MTFPPSTIDPVACPELEPWWLLNSRVPDGTLTDDPSDGGVSLYGFGLCLRMYVTVDGKRQRMTREHVNPDDIPAPFAQHAPNKEGTPCNPAPPTA